MVRYFVSGWEGVRYTHFGQMLFHFRHENIMKRHGRCADFAPDHLEAAADCPGRIGHLRITQANRQFCIFRQGGDHRQQVRLTGAIVADHEQALVVHGVVELELGNDQINELIRHLRRNDVCLDKLPSGGCLVGVPQLNDRFNGVELDQVPILKSPRLRHTTCRLF